MDVAHIRVHVNGPAYRPRPQPALLPLLAGQRLTWAAAWPPETSPCIMIQHRSFHDSSFLLRGYRFRPFVASTMSEEEQDRTKRFACPFFLSDKAAANTSR